FESGTENREGLEMIALGSTDQTAAIGQQIDYQLRLTNTQLAIDNQKKSYTLSVDNTSNTNGVTILFNGNPFTEGQSFSLPKDGTATPVISVISDQAVEEEITLKFVSACEASGGSLLFSDAKLENAKLKATLTIMARFQAPCVEQIDMASPVNNHVVTNASNDIISFKFLLTNPLEGLTDMRVEYRVNGSSTVNTLETITLSDGNKDVQGYYNYNVNVGSLQDITDYEFRLSPACESGTGEWGKAQNPSPWIAVRIDKEVPTIVTVNPQDNTEWTSGPIAVTYNKTLSSVVPNNITLDMVKDGVNTLNITKDIAVSNNQLVITPTYLDKDLEGGVITVTIPAGEVTDIYGNPAATYSWSFLANKNVVSWEAANKQLTGPEGTAIPFSMSIQNDGVVNKTYKLVNLPAWLTSTNKTEGEVYTLFGSGYRDKVDFSISATLNVGTYNHIVQAETPDGVESFRLEVIVTTATVTASISEVNPGFTASIREETSNLEETLEIADFSLTAYPNPFSESTTIVFELPEELPVQLTVFDMMGKHIKTLINGELGTGKHEVSWQRNGKETSRVPRGIYLVKLVVGGESTYHKVVVK
ncbi:T9SS type A sorting domain-containing protein, partial [Xanthovirga aplysinae]|uniref:T9SS type A sorting domain-containing protein n=1 Tax=Xanthovirga aplysinae TaxID=2529853 RepID=UPI0012BB4B71